MHEYLLKGYWKDIGTIDAYYRAHMDLLEGKGLDLDAPGWAILPHPDPYAPAYLAPSSQVTGSMVAHGARVHGQVEASIVGPGVTVEAGARVTVTTVKRSRTPRVGHSTGGRGFRQPSGGWGG